MNLGLLYHTARYLRPRQVYSRVLNKLYRPRPSMAPAPPLRTQTGVWVAPPGRPSVMVGPTTFRFLGETHDVASAHDWNFETDQKVSLYNLHYFDDLNMSGWEERRDWHRSLIGRWVDEYPLGAGIGWDAYPTALRIVNWIKWHLAGNNLDATLLDSLVVQARHLRNNIEWHLLGNHVLADAKGLLFAGVFFSGPEAEKWLRDGIKIFSDEVDEEILADGGHNERSPMYHSIILEDLLDVINLSRAFPDVLRSDQWQQTASKMIAWLEVMTLPDGRIAQFNDAAFGIAPGFEELRHYAALLGVPAQSEETPNSVWLKDSGYSRIEEGDLVLIADIGEIGPSYQPGHAHADTLSFELCIGGRRLVVDSGISTYAATPQRVYERSTRAHNTVEVDGQSSSEVWSSFRVARRAHVHDVKFAHGENSPSLVEAFHDGYMRLPGKVVHRRSWRLENPRLEIEDQLEGRFASAVFRLHLAPEWTVRQIDGKIVCECDSDRVEWEFEGAETYIEGCEIFPTYGESVQTSRIVGTLTGTRCVTRMTWCNYS